MAKNPVKNLEVFLTHSGQLGSFDLKSNFYNKKKDLEFAGQISNLYDQLNHKLIQHQNKVGMFKLPFDIRYGLSFYLCSFFLLLIK